MKRTDTAPAGRKAESRNTYYRIGLAAAALGALILMSCSQDPIFAAIEKEVKLKEPSLRGDITSLVAVDGSLYAANGFLYKRTGGAGDWESVSTGGGDRCAMVATDGTHLYILCTDYDGENGVVRRLKGGTWETVTDISSAVFLSSGSGGVFAFTGSDDSYTAHRITVSPAVTALASGLSTPVGSAALAVSDYFATTGGVYTAAGALVVGPESLTGIRGITTNGTDIYVMTKGDLYRYNGTTWSNTGHSVTEPSGIAWLGGSSGKSLILISGASGFGEVVVDSATGALQSFQNPGDNDSSSIPPAHKTQYENSLDKWAVYRIFAVTSDTVTNSLHTPYALYASVADPNYNGLWSFYPSADSPNWNRE